MELLEIDVRFIKPKKGEAMAVFMNKSAGRYFNSTVYAHLRTCYQHTGQHGECVDSFIREKRATIEEYHDLKKEMENLGYIITIK